jgi:hypothetical protein
LPKWLRIFFTLVVVVAGTNMPILLVSASPFQPHEVTYFPSTMSTGITVTITPLFGLQPPTNFIATISGKDIGLTWGYLSGTTSVLIMRQANAQPLSITDGQQVYTGSGTSFTDVGAANESVQYYYSAWGTDGVLYSTKYASTSAGGWGMVFLGIIVLVVGVSFVALRSPNPLLKMVGLAAWVMFFLYIKNTPPSPIVDGSSTQGVLMIVSWACGIGIILTYFSGEVGRQRADRNGNSYNYSAFKWKFGKDKDEYEGRIAPHNETIEEYQARVRRALHRDK